MAFTLCILRQQFDWLQGFPSIAYRLRRFVCFLVFFQRFFSSCAGGRGSYPDFHTSPAKLPKFLTGFQINYTSQIALLVFPLNFFKFVFICHNKIKEFIIKHTHDNNIGTILLSLTCLTSVAKEQSVKEKDKDERETLIFQLEIAALVIL